MATHVMYRYTSIRSASFLYLARPPGEDRAPWRAKLKEHVHKLESDCGFCTELVDRQTWAQTWCLG